METLPSIICLFPFFGLQNTSKAVIHLDDGSKAKVPAGLRGNQRGDSFRALRAGQKLPSEAHLLDEFSTSRITVIRALRELQQRGLVQRRAGSGTYVTDGIAAGASLLFGLLIPNLGETEIFGPICQGYGGIFSAAQARPAVGRHGAFPGRERNADLDLCRQYVAKKVAGVFFAPLGAAPQNDRIIRRRWRCWPKPAFLSCCSIEVFCHIQQQPLRSRCN